MALMRDLYRAKTASIRGLGFRALIRRSALYTSSRFIRQASDTEDLFLAGFLKRIPKKTNNGVEWEVMMYKYDVSK